MGTTSSSPKHGGQAAGHQMPLHSPLPEEQVPFPGPQAQYKILQMEVICMNGLNSVGQLVTSTNIHSYYVTLAAEYGQGFRLATFYRIPGDFHMTGLVPPIIAAPFQAIFYRYSSVPPDGTWKLHIEKSMMQVNRMFSGIKSLHANRGLASDTSHIMDTIANISRIGGRLLCTELSGQQFGQTPHIDMHGDSCITGVDVFFELPLHPHPTLYTYQAISIPIDVTYAGKNPVPTCHCDWMGSLCGHLNQGWKLVEIFTDMSTMSDVGQTGMGMHTNETLNSMWFFEKEAALVQDTTPRYQGTIIMNDIKVNSGFGESTALPQWNNIMEQMGQRGWEFACFLEIPDVVRKDFGAYSQKVLMFFQRRVVAQAQDKAQFPKEAPPAPTFSPTGAEASAPPSYDDAVQNQKM